MTTEKTLSMFPQNVQDALTKLQAVRERRPKKEVLGYKETPEGLARSGLMIRANEAKDKVRMGLDAQADSIRRTAGLSEDAAKRRDEEVVTIKARISTLNAKIVEYSHAENAIGRYSGAVKETSTKVLQDTGLNLLYATFRAERDSVRAEIERLTHRIDLLEKRDAAAISAALKKAGLRPIDIEAKVAAELQRVTNEGMDIVKAYDERVAKHNAEYAGFLAAWEAGLAEALREANEALAHPDLPEV